MFALGALGGVQPGSWAASSGDLGVRVRFVLVGCSSDDAIRTGKPQIVALVYTSCRCVKDRYRHCKTTLALGASAAMLHRAGIPAHAADIGVLVAPD